MRSRRTTPAGPRCCSPRAACRRIWRAASILPGVTRALVIALARRAGLRVREEHVTVARLRRAREICLTASTIEVLPVVRLDGRAVGRGRPGPVTLRLQSAYAGHVAAALRRGR